MPYYLILLVCAMFIVPIQAENTLCLPCDTLCPVKDSVILRDKQGDFGLYSRITRVLGYTKPDNSVSAYQIRDVRETVKFLSQVIIQKHSGITEQLANKAFHQDDSLVKASTKTKYFGPGGIFKKKIREGIMYLDDPEVKTVLIGKKDVDQEPKLSLDIVFALLTILIFSLLISLILSDGFTINKNECLGIMAFSIACLAVVTWFEFRTISGLKLSLLPLLLEGVNLGFQFSLLALMLTVCIWQSCKWSSWKITMAKKILAIVGIVTTLEIIFFLGVRTLNLQYLLIYLGVAVIPYLIFNLIPFSVKQVKLVRRRKPAKNTKTTP